MRVCSFAVCCNGVCKSGLSPTKTKFEWYTPTRHKGINAAFSHWIPSVSVVQFTVQMSKLNGLGKTHRERIFVVELKLKLRSLFHYEQIVWENSDIKWMKVPSFSLTVTKYLTFQLSGYFLWTIKINCRRFLGRLSTNVTDTIAYINSFRNQYFSVNKSDLRERERREDS